jgi:hypothetical protein
MLSRDTMPTPTDRLFQQLDDQRQHYGRGAGAAKTALLRELARRQLPSAERVRRFHETLCFWRAYPDDQRVLRAVERELARFRERLDVRRFRRELRDSGIAGTDIVYRFTEWTARWLAAHWRDAMSIEWDEVPDRDRLARLLFLLALPAEAPGFDEPPVPVERWVRALAGPGRSDAGWLIDRAGALAVPQEVRVRLFDELDLPLRVAWRPGAPSRTAARFEPSPVVFQRTPPSRERPDLRAEAVRPPDAIRPVGPAHAERLVHLAHEAMVTRERDLDAFAWADVRDVRLIECGGGLQFACIGVRPEKRFLLESVYGLLTLKNGVPIGYALASGLFESAEIAYNVFASFRGGEAAHVYARLLAAARALFGCDTFSVPPYQLGDGNDEGLVSGAWWFYRKLGLEPWTAAAQSLMRREAVRVDRNPGYRTPIAVLKRLVRHSMFLSLGRRRADVIGWQRFDRLGLAVTAHIVGRFGTDRDRAREVLADEAGATLGVDNWRRLQAGERVAWQSWAPLVAILPGVKRWSSRERAALAAVIRAKGGRRESDFVPLFDGHAKLRAAILEVARTAQATGRS